MAKQTYTTGQVLTAAQMTTLQANDYNQTVSAKVASYTLVATDAGTRITMSNASATTVTVNTSLFTAGDTLTITNIGAGVCTITAGTATVSSAGSLALNQYDSGTLYFTSTGVSIWNGANPGDITAVTAGTGISGGGTSGAVTVTNSMATAITTNGDVIYGTGSGTFTRLGIGSSAQVLTVTSGVPVWATPSGASGPTFQAQRASDQSIAAGTWVKLQLTQENWDTAGCYDNTTNYRFTPTTSGYYQVNMRMGMGIDNGGQITAPNIYKNGAATNIYAWSNNTSGTTTSMSAASGQLYFNGSTDYIEMYGFCNTGTTRNVAAGTYMDAVWIRS